MPAATCVFTTAAVPSISFVSASMSAAAVATGVSVVFVSKPVSALAPFRRVASTTSALDTVPATAATLATEPEYFTPKRP